MRARTFILVCVLACSAWIVPALAQEGHPLKGSWLGEWGPNARDRNQVLVVMDYDGKNITGMINPGTDNIAIQKATLNPEGWTVRLEADFKDRTGKAIHYVIDGKIENLGLYNRSISGTWSHPGGKGDFKITRQ
jgi:hypothetical protein